ncbi:MAG: hypothetical protein IT276_08860 [Ignavibacteriaceae bacterium]|nr:hypothetical protein [Ignavibacteriaceae bacterium]
MNKQMNKLMLEKINSIYPKLNSIFLFVALASYIVGFIISNIYFGYFNVLVFELFKVRYILVGVLFSLFLGVLYLLLYGFTRTIIKNIHLNFFKLILKYINYSFVSLFILAAALNVVLIIYSGSSNYLPSGIPNISQELDLTSWLDNSFSKLTIDLGKIIVVAMIFLILAILIYFFGEKKDTSKLKRIILAVGTSTGLFFFIFFIIKLSDLLNYFTSLDIEPTNNSSISQAYIGLNWFLIGVLAIYLFTSIIRFFIIYVGIKGKESATESGRSIDANVQKILGSLYLFSLISVLVIPLYALRIYPNLPQQIGGGMLVRVNVTTNIDRINQELKKNLGNIYLLEKTNNSSFFLVIDSTSKNLKTVELSNNNIEQIEYIKKTNFSK